MNNVLESYMYFVVKWCRIYLFGLIIIGELWTLQACPLPLLRWPKKILGDMSPKLWPDPPPLSPFRGKTSRLFRLFFYIYQSNWNVLKWRIFINLVVILVIDLPDTCIQNNIYYDMYTLLRWPGNLHYRKLFQKKILFRTRACWIFFTFCLKKIDFFSGRGVDKPLPPLGGNNT